MNRIKFEVREIITCSDGTVLLKGPRKETLRIVRTKDGYSSAAYCDWHVLDVHGPAGKHHRCKVSDIDTDLYCNLAF